MDIEKLMERPKRIEVDGQVVENHDAADLVEVDRYLESKKATRKRRFPVRVARMMLGGAI